MALVKRSSISENQITRTLAQQYIALAARSSSAFGGTFTIDYLKTHNLYEKEILMARIEHLERAFPSSPHIAPKIVVSVTSGASLNSEAFVARYAAQAFVLAVINDREYKWLSDNEIKVDGTIIKCEQGLEDIIEHKLTKQEKEWELPEPYKSRAYFLATGIRHEPKLPPNPILDEKQTRAVEKRLATKDRRKKAAEEHGEAPAKRSPPPPRADRKGLVTIQDICATLKIEPRIARGILRKKNEPKPAEGWAWDKKTAATVEAMIRKELKK